MEINREQYQYIWFLLYQLTKESHTGENLKYILSKNISPYSEMNMEDLNYSNIADEKTEVEINPFYRFTDVVNDLLNPDLIAAKVQREELFNIVFHILANLDLQEGLNKRVLTSRLIIESIESGRYGDEIRELFRILNKREKVTVADGIQDKYNYLREIEVFKKVFKSVYPDSLIYDSLDKEEELVLFINEKKTPENRKKEKLLEKLFLPVGLKCRKTWEYHFGIMGVDETMVLGELLIY